MGKRGGDEDSLNHIVMHYIENIFEKYENITPKTAGLYYIAYLYTPATHYVHSLEHSFQEFIKKNVLNGTLPADLYMDLEDEYLWWNDVVTAEKEQCDPNGYGQGSYYFYVLDGTVFITYPTNLKLVNKRRKALGISETFEDLVKKIIWENTHNIVKWHSIVTIGYGDEKTDKEKATKMKQEIDAEHAAGDFHRMYYEKGSKVSE